MFNNPKDIPYAAGYAWSLYFIIKAYVGPKNVSKGALALVGASIGLTMGIRVGGIVLLGYFILAMLLRRDRREGMAGYVLAARRLPGQILFIAIIGWPLMAAFWPYALVSPLRGPFEALATFSRFPWQGLVLFDGRLLPVSSLPWDYVPRLFLLKTPEIIAPLLTLGILLAIQDAFLSRARGRQAGARIVLVAAIGVPVLYAVIMGSVLYNGM